MTKADKKLVKAAMDALQVYWYTHGVIEYGHGDTKCVCCAGCVHCDIDDAWSAWEDAEARLLALIG